MDTTDDTHRLLTEIRDLQRETLSEYRSVTAHSLKLQEQAVARQEQLGSLYRRALIAGGILILPLLGLLLYLITLLP